MGLGSGGAPLTNISQFGGSEYLCNKVFLFFVIILLLPLKLDFYCSNYFPYSLIAAIKTLMYVYYIFVGSDFCFNFIASKAS